MPLARGRRGSRRRKRVNRAGIVQRVMQGIRVGIEARVVDLDLVALVDWDRPVIAGIRKTDEHAGVIGGSRRTPVHTENEILKLLSGEPQQADSAEALDDIATEFDEPAAPRHSPSGDTARTDRG